MCVEHNTLNYEIDIFLICSGYICYFRTMKMLGQFNEKNLTISATSKIDERALHKRWSYYVPVGTEWCRNMSHISSLIAWLTQSPGVPSSSPAAADILPWCTHMQQAWGQSTRYFGTLVLEYRFFSTRRYSVLVLLKSTCTRTCTQELLKIKVLLTSTYEYFMSTCHLKLI